MVLVFLYHGWFVFVYVQRFPEVFPGLSAKRLILMSWYHYYLDERSVAYQGVNVPNRTSDLFRLLKVGGIFILQIVTDFSGRRTDGDVHQNEMNDYIGLFEQFGEIILKTDFEGNILESESDSKRAKGGVIIATRK